MADEAWVHSTAIVEDGVVLGSGTRVWDSAHLRSGAVVGAECIVGEKTYIAYDVVIGDHVKINTAAYLCAGVRVGDFCMISAHVVFTNDRYPRSGNRELTGLETSEPTEDTLPTLVERGVTIGANATIGPGITIGKFAMIGMGAVVTRNVPPHALVAGNPAHPRGWVCVCGQPLPPLDADPDADESPACSRCARAYQRVPQGVRFLDESASG